MELGAVMNISALLHTPLWTGSSGAPLCSYFTTLTFWHSGNWNPLEGWGWELLLTVKRQQAAHLLIARMCSDLKGMQMNGRMHIAARSILNLAETQPLQASLWMCIYSFLQYASLKYFFPPSFTTSSWDQLNVHGFSVTVQSFVLF